MENWLPGYSARELEDAQSSYRLTFPPDLLSLLEERRPARGYDWRCDHAGIRRAMARLDSLVPAFEFNAVWWPEWGDRPDSEQKRASIVAGILASAPKLIPIMGNRYIPEEPNEAGNPVFSVMQLDTIYYGANLTDFFRREFDPSLFTGEPIVPPLRRIVFWSDLVDRNG